MRFRFHLSDCVWYSERREVRNYGWCVVTLPGEDHGRPHEITFEVSLYRVPENGFIGRYLQDGTPVYMTPESIDIVHRHRFPEFGGDRVTAFYIDLIEQIG